MEDFITIAIIDYKAGNAASVMHAVTHLGHDAVFAHNEQDVRNASHIILPGVGSARATMESLYELKLIDALEEAVLRKKVFFLGICVGLQILFEHSDEGDVDCFGWLNGNVKRFDASKVRVPQMGWNEVRFIRDTPAAGFGADIKSNYFYFVNSYYAAPKNKNDVWGSADYPDSFTAAVHRDNIYATQFHAEKSGEAGLALLEGFFKLTGEA